MVYIFNHMKGQFCWLTKPSTIAPVGDELLLPGCSGDGAGRVPTEAQR